MTQALTRMTTTRRRRKRWTTSATALGMMVKVKTTAVRMKRLDGEDVEEEKEHEVKRTHKAAR